MRYRELLGEAPTGLPAHAPTVDSPAFRAWFGNSKVVDADGRPLPVYHGTGRPDRVGTRFRKARATAGPMSYFTDDPAVASGYAGNAETDGKADTSLTSEEMDYPNWFMVNLPGTRSEVPITRTWWFLNPEQQRQLAMLAPRVTRNDEDEIVLGGPEITNGIGNYRDALRDARGNVLAALVDGWLFSGPLFGDEQEFLKVLRLAGFPYPVRYNDPHARYPFVYAVYMSIQTPLDTSHIPPAVVEALREAATRQKRGSTGGTFDWDKSRIGGQEWFEWLLHDFEQNTTHAWTIVPDWVTKVLKSFGYDGIKDTGGKNGGIGHIVWIPFEEWQVKSAISNRKFNPSKSNIHETT